jgi:hypothetical protein
MLVCHEDGTYGSLPSPFDRFFLYRKLDDNVIFWFTGGPEWSQSYRAALSLARAHALLMQAMYPGSELFILEVL